MQVTAADRHALLHAYVRAGDRDSVDRLAGRFNWGRGKVEGGRNVLSSDKEGGEEGEGDGQYTSAGLLAVDSSQASEAEWRDRGDSSPWEAANEGSSDDEEWSVTEADWDSSERDGMGVSTGGMDGGDESRLVQLTSLVQAYAQVGCSRAPE